MKTVVKCLVRFSNQIFVQWKITVKLLCFSRLLKLPVPDELWDERPDAVRGCGQHGLRARGQQDGQGTPVPLGHRAGYVTLTLEWVNILLNQASMMFVFLVWFTFSDQH
jgi:hypothetical protein